MLDRASFGIVELMLFVTTWFVVSEFWPRRILLFVRLKPGVSPRIIITRIDLITAGRLVWECVVLTESPLRGGGCTVHSLEGDSQPPRRFVRSILG